MCIKKCWRLSVNGLLVFLLVSLLGGCASLLSLSEYPVAIDSDPSGVDFYVTDSTGNRVHSGVTPKTVTLATKRGYFKPHTYTIHLQPVGLPPKRHTIRNSTDGWYFGNLLLGGFLGMLIVDPLTGAMFKYPAEVTVELEQSSAASDSTAVSELRIVSIETLDQRQRAALIPLTD